MSEINIMPLNLGPTKKVTGPNKRNRKLSDPKVKILEIKHKIYFFDCFHKLLDYSNCQSRQTKNGFKYFSSLQSSFDNSQRG